jgi:hypothetical protein
MCGEKLDGNIDDDFWAREDERIEGARAQTGMRVLASEGGGDRGQYINRAKDS